MMVVKESVIDKAPESDITEWQKMTEVLMVGFKELPPSEQKKALQSAIERISTNLNELRTQELRK